jgi:hypothetical protein
MTTAPARELVHDDEWLRTASPPEPLASLFPVTRERRSAAVARFNAWCVHEVFRKMRLIARSGSRMARVINTRGGLFVISVSKHDFKSMLRGEAVYQAVPFFVQTPPDEWWPPQARGPPAVLHGLALLIDVVDTCYFGTLVDYDHTVREAGVNDEFVEKTNVDRAFCRLLLSRAGGECVCCGVRNATKSCGHCRVKYCSSACQQADWNAHKMVCAKVAQHLATAPEAAEGA